MIAFVRSSFDSPTTTRVGTIAVTGAAKPPGSCRKSKRLGKEGRKCDLEHGFGNPVRSEGGFVVASNATAAPRPLTAKQRFESHSRDRVANAICVWRQPDRRAL